LQDTFLAEYDMGMLTPKHQVAKAKILHSRDMDEVRALLQDARRDLSLERQQNGFKVMALEKEVCDPEQPGKVGTPQNGHFRVRVLSRALVSTCVKVS
jgi:hypothetical protein